MLTVAFVVYSAVLTAELVGDKVLHAAATLSTRYRPSYVFAGFAVAAAAKMLAAVLFGQAIAGLPKPVVTGMTAATLFATAGFLALGRRSETPADPAVKSPRSRAAWAPFLPLLLAEWGDVGQMTAAALAAQFGRPAVVWISSTLALATKGAIAVLIGVRIRGYVSETRLRQTAVVICAALAILALYDSFA